MFHEHMGLTQLLFVVFLCLAWCPIFQCTMRTSCIIEFNVGVDSSFKFRFRVIIPPINFLLFERRKKGFSYCVVMWFSRIRKRLDYCMLLKYLLDPMRCILGSTVTVEQETRLWST